METHPHAQPRAKAGDISVMLTDATIDDSGTAEAVQRIRAAHDQAIFVAPRNSEHPQYDPRFVATRTQTLNRHCPTPWTERPGIEQ
ncbi:hypothetical protein [Nocardia rhamnosiphila]|uniref:Uncharacterized protein n=1 Tax=Nocardia rhamnosiphila TaxID=426716 RepID=A0ABV2WMJ5_9NOCA